MLKTACPHRKQAGMKTFWPHPKMCVIVCHEEATDTGSCNGKNCQAAAKLIHVTNTNKARDQIRFLHHLPATVGAKYTIAIEYIVAHEMEAFPRKTFSYFFYLVSSFQEKCMETRTHETAIADTLDHWVKFVETEVPIRTVT